MVNNIKHFLKRNRQIIVLLTIAFFVRVFFLDKYVNVCGDLLLYADWGEKYWEYGSKSFYFVRDWYYAPPNYPPLINLYYAYAYKAFDYKYLFAQLHNLIKIPPSAFIVYYYKWGYFINLKFFAVLSDLILGAVLYNEVGKFVKNKRVAILSGALYLFNPAVIIASSLWGQTDGVIALLSVVSVIMLLRRKFVLSSLFFTAGLLFKPNWIVFIPLYLFIYISRRPKTQQVVLSLIFITALALASAIPFTNDPFSFYKWLLNERIIATLRISPHASISAFNFYTIFMQIDRGLASHPILFIPVKYIGYFIFSVIYIYSLAYLKIKKVNIENVFKVIVVIGLGSFLFIPGMLERYFFSAVAPFAFLAIKNKRLLWLYVIFSITCALNLIWALFRRRYGNINDIFAGNGHSLIKVISAVNVIGYLYLVRFLFSDNLIKLNLWKKQVNILLRRRK